MYKKYDTWIFISFVHLIKVDMTKGEKCINRVVLENTKYVQYD